MALVAAQYPAHVRQFRIEAAVAAARAAAFDLDFAAGNSGVAYTHGTAAAGRVAAASASAAEVAGPDTSQFAADAAAAVTLAVAAASEGASRFGGFATDAENASWNETSVDALSARSRSAKL